MRKTTASIIAAVSVGALVAATGASAADQPLQISYPTDGALTCEQLQAETVRMDEIIAGATNSAAKADSSANAANMASSAVVNGALYSGALGRVPGLGMFANAAGGLARKKADTDKANAATTIQTATSRRAVLQGIYSGKNCQQAQIAAAIAAATAGAAGAPGR